MRNAGIKDLPNYEWVYGGSSEPATFKNCRYDWVISMTHVTKPVTFVLGFFYDETKLMVRAYKFYKTPSLEYDTIADSIVLTSYENLSNTFPHVNFTQFFPAEK